MCGKADRQVGPTVGAFRKYLSAAEFRRHHLHRQPGRAALLRDLGGRFEFLCAPLRSPRLCVSHFMAKLPVLRASTG